MIVRLIPIEETIAKIVDDLNIGDKDIPLESIAEWILSGLKRIGAYDQFESKRERVKITDYVGLLPADFYRVDATKLYEPHKVGHNTITVGFKTGSLELDYLAMPIDEKGYPLVPEEEAYQEALLWLVASKLALRDELTNKQITFEYADTRWRRWMLSARAEANMGDMQFLQKRVNDSRRLKYSLNPLIERSFGKQEFLNRDNRF